MLDFKGKVSSLADIEEIEKIPLEERYSEKSTYELIQTAARDYSDQIALRFLHNCTAEEEPEDISYRELLKKVTQTANMFNDFGLKKNEAVSYLLPNLPETQYTIWGGQAAGIVSAVNPLLRPEQIVEILRATKCKMLVALAPTPGSDIWEKTQVVIQQMPELEVIFQVGGAGDPEKNIYPFTETMEKYSEGRLESGRVFDPEEICAYFHTGGTTGSPKVAQHTHKGEIYEAWATQYLSGYETSSVALVGLPLFHVNAVLVSSLAAFRTGSTALFLSAAGFRHPNAVPNFWKIVDRYRASHFVAVPTIYSALLNIPLEGADVSSLRFGVCGAAPMPQEVIRKFEDMTGIAIMEGYGLTEGTSVSVCNPAAGERPVGSIGIRYPYQDVAVKVIGEDGKAIRNCDINEVGNICIKGPNVIPGYLQEQFNTSLFAEEGWLNTGDLGSVDEKGYFWLTGRAKDLIIRGGHNIDPGMIEECLHTHPEVLLAAAVGRPDSYAGEIPVAYVQLNPGSTVTAEDLRSYAEEHIFERPALPAEVLLVDTMPVTAVGKIFKPTLRYDIIQRTFEPLLKQLETDDVIFRVTVAAEGSHGTLATVTADISSSADRSKIEDQVKDKLGVFSVKFVIDFKERIAV
ncbi:MAG: acyl-CoA synthetase [Sneathiellales bacterium]|nr:acyl-CoA synthetase [Sneathiellales bacterium]